MTVNKTRTKKVSFEGARVFDVKDPFKRLEMATLSSFFGEPSFYRNGLDNSHRWILECPDMTRLSPVEWAHMTTAQVTEKAIDDALSADLVRTLDFAVKLRKEHNFRVTPQVIMVRAAMHPSAMGNNRISRYSSAIMSRVDEVMTQAAYWATTYGNGKLAGLPSRLKRAWAKRLRSATAYELAKYRMEGREVNLYDVCNVSHPKSPYVDALMKGNLKLVDDRQTWESIRSNGGSWEDAVKVMGHMALLRNLRNIEDIIDDSILDKLVNGVATGKQMPFRYYSAYQNVTNPRVMTALDDCIERSIGNLPFIGNKVACITDVSGSMGSPVSEKSSISMRDIGFLMTALTAKSAKGCTATLFGTCHEDVPISGKSSVFDTIRNLREKGDKLGHGTLLSPVFQNLLASGKAYDTIMVFSDMEISMYDGNTLKNISNYIKLNPNVEIFFVNLTANTRSIVPEFFKGCTFLTGWSDKIFHLVNEVLKSNGKT